MKFPVRTVALRPTGFLRLCSHRFCLEVFPDSLCDVILERCFFSSLLFSLHVFIFSPFFFLWLILSFIPSVFSKDA